MQITVLRYYFLFLDLDDYKSEAGNVYDMPTMYPRVKKPSKIAKAVSNMGNCNMEYILELIQLRRMLQNKFFIL